MLIGDLLRGSAVRLPDKAALICGTRTLTYREFDQAADRAAGAMAALGLSKGARIGVLAPNILEYPILYFGAARAGVIIANITTRATANDLAYMLRKTGVEVLVYARELAATVREIRDVPALRHRVCIGAPDAGAMTFDEFMAHGDGQPPPITLSDTDPLSMTFTGGTTGFPKAVLATHKARLATAQTCIAEFGLDSSDIAIMATPLFHAAGVYVWLQPAVALGCTCILMPGWDPKRLLELVERHRATAVLLVPSQLAHLLDEPGFSATRLASLRHINYAGAPMPLALFDRLAAALPHVAFTENYGQSETGGPITVRRPSHPHAVRGSVGVPALGVEARVVDKDGNDVAVGAIGEIVTRGDHLLSCYWDNPEQTASLFKSGEGWLWTGDLGVRDAAGFITLVDRSRDVIMSGAENIYPTEIENALHKHPDVVECAAFGVPDDRWGEVPAVHVVLRSNARATPDELGDFVGKVIARYKRPRVVKLVDKLPKTPVGKVQRNVIRASYWEGRAKRI